jgi:hypothetical protein
LLIIELKLSAGWKVVLVMAYFLKTLIEGISAYGQIKCWLVDRRRPVMRTGIVVSEILAGNRC